MSIKFKKIRQIRSPGVYAFFIKSFLESYLDKHMVEFFTDYVTNNELKARIVEKNWLEETKEIYTVYQKEGYKFLVIIKKCYVVYQGNKVKSLKLKLVNLL